MRAAARMESELLGPDLDKMWPLIPHGQSDTACLDNALELLVAGGYPLAHAVMMLIPEAWAGNKLMDAKRKAFYEYHAALMEPWDGPAAIAFTDGRQIGATLDRNGLRPARYIVTDDDLVIMASESGVLPMPEEKIKRKWRLQPGKMLLIDLEEGRIVEDEEIKRKLADAEPYEEWLKAAQFKLEELPDLPEDHQRRRPTIPSLLLDRQQAFGYTQEDLQFFLEPMASAGDDPVGSMGTDTPIAVLSKQAQAALQLFQAELRPGHQSADRSDPRGTGDGAGLDDRAAAQPARPRRGRAQAAGSRAAGADQRRSGEDPLDLRTGRRRLPHRDHRLHLAGVRRRGRSVERASQRICHEATDAVLADNNILILSDRAVVADRIPVPALLATAAVHHHLIRQGLRMQTGLVVETGEAREVHHFCVLAGYGAEAINPYLAFETLEQIRVQPGPVAQALRSAEELHQGDRQGRAEGDVQDGHLHLSVLLRRADFRRGRACPREFVEKYFTGTATTIEGIGLKEIAEECVRRHRDAYGDNPDLSQHARCRRRLCLPPARRGSCLDAGIGVAAAACGARQQSGRISSSSPRPINEQSERLLTLRGLMEFKTRRRADAAGRGRARGRDRQALRHRRDELRLDLAARRIPRSPSP